MDSIHSVDITPDFDVLYRRFKGELQAEAKRLAQEGSLTELLAVRSLLVPLAIMVTSLTSPDVMNDFQEVIAQASCQIAPMGSERRHVPEVGCDPIGQAHDAKMAAQDDDSPSDRSDGLFCPICAGHEAYAYTGVDGKPHVQCPRCGIIA